MKVLIVGFFTRTYMPYIERYERILKEFNIEYDIIYFDRDSSGESVKDGNSFIFKSITTASKIKKILPVFKYRNYIRSIVKENKYDKLIFLTTMPALLIGKDVLKKYKENYIFDYRDYTYEKFNFYRKKVDEIIKNSFITLMSSKGYLDFFKNKEKVLQTHNISNIEGKIESAIDLKNKEKIRIGFLGYVRYFDVNSKLINSFKNDPKYILDYYGTVFSDCNLKEFCLKNNINNVYLKGKFNNQDKALIYKEIDIINSIYSLDSPEVKPAIPNRLYDCILFKKPILVSKGTFLSEIVEKYQLGLSLDLNSNNWKEELENYISIFDKEKFEKNCNTFLEKVMEDEKKCDEIVKKFLNKFLGDLL